MNEQKDFFKIVTENKRPEYTPSKLYKKSKSLRNQSLKHRVSKRILSLEMILLYVEYPSVNLKSSI